MNSSLTPKVLASAASGVIPLIEANHGDPDLIFGRSGIQSTDLENPTNELNLGQFCHLFTEASHQTGNDNFGLHFGSDFEPRRLGAIGYAAISSPTLAAGLRNMEAYFPAHQEQSSFGLIRDDDMLWLSYRINDLQIRDRRHDAELSMGMFLNIFRHALGPDWCPLEMPNRSIIRSIKRYLERLYSSADEPMPWPSAQLIWIHGCRRLTRIFIPSSRHFCDRAVNCMRTLRTLRNQYETRSNSISVRLFPLSQKLHNFLV